MRRRPLLRAAAVGGGAYLAGKRAGQGRADQESMDAQQDQRISALEQQQAGAGYPPSAAPPSAPAPAPEQAAGPSMPDQLNQIAELHQQGVLTDAEFAAAKAKLLGN